MQTITEDFCFNPQRKHSILLSQKAFSLYVEKFQEDQINNSLEGLPIFLDTNVILGYYGMAQKEKDKLYAFLQEQKERIILTRRVEEEFMKNTNTSCLFLTNDIKKADWLQDDYRPFPHYIENTYFLTKQVMLIFYAESALRNINFENVHSANIDSESEEDTIENEDNFEEEYNLGFTASEHLMRLVLARGSFESNQRNNVYYHPETRGFRDHKYIGLYLNKSIKAIGKITNIITAYLDENNNLVVISSKFPVTNKEEQQIKNSIEEGYDLGWDVSRGERFFCVDNFFPTNFKKISAYAPMGTKFFDLRQVLNVKEIELETSEIAKLLDGKEWI